MRLVVEEHFWVARNSMPTVSRIGVGVGCHACCKGIAATAEKECLECWVSTRYDLSPHEQRLLLEPRAFIFLIEVGKQDCGQKKPSTAGKLEDLTSLVAITL